MVRWGMDWLIKAHPNNNTLYVQVTEKKAEEADEEERGMKNALSVCARFFLPRPIMLTSPQFPSFERNVT